MQLLNQFKIPDTKVNMILRDSAANVHKALEESPYDHVSCFLHSLQLVVNDAIFAQRAMIDTVGKARKIVGHFSHSCKATAKLEEIQEKKDLPKHRLIQDVATRWNSTFKMLERLYEQRLVTN